MKGQVYLAGRWVGDIDEAIEAYQPAFAAEQWYVQARPYLNELVRLARPSNAVSARNQIQALSYAARFANEREQPLVAESFLSPAFVDWYLEISMTEHGAHSKSTHRAALTAIGTAATTRAPWTKPRPRYPRANDALPYSPSEVSDYMALVDKQKTRRRSRLLEGLLALGIGAGLRGTEMTRVWARHVHREDDFTVIHVPGDSSRTVPFRRRFAPVVNQMALDHEAEPLLGPFREDQRDPLSRMKSLLHIPDYAPPLELRRLRATWMVQVLNEDVQLATFAEAAGVTDLRFTALLPYLTTRKDRDAEYLGLAGSTS